MTGSMRQEHGLLVHPRPVEVTAMIAHDAVAHQQHVGSDGNVERLANRILAGREMHHRSLTA